MSRPQQARQRLQGSNHDSNLVRGSVMADVDSSGAAQAPDIITRAEARQHGLLRYFTGKPCKAGHIAERLTVNGSCVECTRQRRVEAYRRNPTADLARQKVYRERNRDDNLRRKREKRLALDPALADRNEARDRERALRSAARSRGEAVYASSRPCVHGHGVIRFSDGGRCVECNRLSCAQRHSMKRFPGAGDRASAISDLVDALRRAARRLRTEEESRLRHDRGARRRALQAGEQTYYGRPCPKGHGGLRYQSGNCVECAAIYAASDAKKAYDRAYLARHRERILRRASEYAARNTERRVAMAREWAKRNAEKRRIISQSYKHRRRQLEAGGDTTAVIAAWIAAAPKVCHWCGAKCASRFHVDHYDPLAKGGKHEVKNLVIACPPCNLKKSARDPYAFAQSRGRLF